MMRLAATARRIICIEPFPAGWSKEKAVREVAKSLKKVAKSMNESTTTEIMVKEMIRKGTIPTISDEGFKILIGIGKDKRFITAYPRFLE